MKVVPILKEVGLVDTKTGSLEDLITGNHNFAKQSHKRVEMNDAVNDDESKILN